MSAHPDHLLGSRSTCAEDFIGIGADSDGRCPSIGFEHELGGPTNERVRNGTEAMHMRLSVNEAVDGVLGALT
jgi:hypothetical protein